MLEALLTPTMDKNERLHIVNLLEGSRVPYLRGILTRSLQNAGLSFEKAYAIASAVRNNLTETQEITNSDLRTTVCSYLEENGFDQYVESYISQSIDQPQIKVITGDGAETPFSKGQLADSLEICALPREEIYKVVTAIESELWAAERPEITSKEITNRVLELLEIFAGPSVSKAYRKWVKFSHTGRPLIILIGGTNGSGKSSIGSELAHRLDIVRTQSTDMLREVMRLLAPARLVPTLHTSSFDAYTRMPSVSETYKSEEMIHGYLTQSSQVAVGVEGVLNRTCNEQVSLILEGVHLHPQIMDQIVRETNAVVVPVLLTVLRPKRLQKRLVGRGQVISSRRSSRYLENFNKIWDLQTFLISQADDYKISIINNEDEDETIRQIMLTITEKLESLSE